MTDIVDNSLCVLILSPTARDGEIAAEVLQSAGLSAHACTTTEELCLLINEGCGAVIVSEEALDDSSIVCLRESLDNQEAWSDLPIILLTRADVVRVTEIFSKSGNIALLERPFSRLTLIRSAEVALRARTKQYEVRNLVRALKKAKDDAERANLTKSQFLANMSHEIRTPIGAIMGFIDLIRISTPGPDEMGEFLGIIDRNSKHLLRLIDDILDLSKVEAGKMLIEHIKFRLSDFLADFLHNMNLRAAEKGVLFQMHMTSQIPDKILSDPFRLKQILSNVVGNAIKFTSHGYVSMAVSFEGGELCFKVEDSGIGISAEQAAKLFQPFAQADSSTTRKFGGTGLGLILSRRLAEALGGALTLLSSKPGQGSVFEIRIRPELPSDASLVEMTEFSTASAAANGDNPSDSHALDGLRVLLIEDSVDNQVLISAYLRSTGAKIEIRSDGEKGVLAALAADFDVILMDIQMPRMDGHEATQKLRRAGYAKPIIALTAHAMEEERMRCLNSGFTDYLTKPIQPVVLTEVLSRFLKTSDSRGRPTHALATPN